MLSKGRRMTRSAGAGLIGQTSYNYPVASSTHPRKNTAARKEVRPSLARPKAPPAKPQMPPYGLPRAVALNFATPMPADVVKYNGA